MKKRKITIFYDNTTYTLRWLSALDWSKSSFSSRNFKITYWRPFHGLFSLNKVNCKKMFNAFKKKRFDIVFLAFHHTSDFYKQDYINLVKYAKQRCNKLVWLDTSDSCGTCNFKIIEYVDFYLKKQMYKDFNLYKREVWGGRLFCEFYHNLTGLDDKVVEDDKQGIIPSGQEDKMKISWNVGLGNLIDQKFSLFFHLKKRKWLFFEKRPMIKAKYDFHYRGSRKTPIAGFQRNKIMDMLDEVKNIYNLPDYNFSVPQKTYYEEILNSKSVISPFGWGEICTRDFEAFFSGSLLIKPSMDHMITYPDVFQNSTYVKIDWDLGNFYNVLKNVYSNYDGFRVIAENGRKTYMNYLSKEGKEMFCLHVLEAIGETNE